MTKTSGIYKIRNVTTGDFYIGSSAHIEMRWSRHRTNLTTNKHHNIILQRAWNKYGAMQFEFSVLERVEQALLLTREQYYLSELRPVYNISTDASAPMRGRKHSQSAIEKITKSSTGRMWKASDIAVKNMRRSAIISGKNKPVEAIDPTTGEIKYRFETIGDVADMEWKKSAVIRCCNGKMKSYQGLLWKYENASDLDRNVSIISDLVRAKISAGRKGKTHTPEVREKIAATHEWRPVASFDPKTGEIVKTYERMRAVEADGFAQCRVWVCCQGKTKKNKTPTHGGYGWKYLN